MPDSFEFFWLFIHPCLKAFLELVHSGLNSLVKILYERLCRPKEAILPGQVNNDENECDDNHLGDEERPRYLVK